jgi:putative ABC transport system permease protein
VGGLWIWLRAETRRRWRSWLAVALVAGVGWGAVITAVAGARRTQSAFPRFVAYSRAPDLLLTPERVGYAGYSSDVAKLPEVADSAPLAGLNAFVTDPKPPPSFALGAPFFPLDGRLGRTLDRPKILRGRLPDPRSDSEALASPSFVDQLGIDVGALVTLQTGGEAPPGQPRFIGKSFSVRIVGVGVTQNEAFPITVFDRAQPLLLLTPAAWKTWHSPESDAFDGLMIRLRPGADPSALQRGAERLLAKHPEAGSVVAVSNEGYRPGIVSRSMRPQVTALLAFAGALGLTLVLVMMQTIARQILIQGGDYPSLRALGSSSRALMWVAVVPAAVSALVAAAIAVAVAIAASPLMPIGAARIAEPTPGVSIDATVLGLGGLALVVILAIAALLPAGRASRAAASGEMRSDALASSRPSLATRLARAGLRAPASTGVRMALESGSGRSAVPVRTVMLGAIISMIALTGAYTFGASLDRAIARPETFGQRWDRMVDAQFESVDVSSLKMDDPSFAAVAGGAYSPGLLVVDGTGFPAIAIDQLKGSVSPTTLEGRPPRSADEIALGTSTMHQLHARIGGTVRIARGDDTVPMKVVGRVVFPAFGIGAFTPTGLGEGVELTVAGLGDLTFLEPGDYSFLLVRFAAHPSAAAVRRVDDACGPINIAGGLCLVQKTQQPPEIASYAQVRDVPWILAALLAALSAATLTHGLIATVQRRRRDLALLKTLGFVRRQISSAVTWQATTLVAVGMIGIPFGVVLGRWTWTALAGQLGILADPRIPLATVALTIPAGILLANVVAAIPGRAASRTRPALVLRTE